MLNATASLILSKADGNQNVRRLRTCSIDLLDARISAKSSYSLTKL